MKRALPACMLALVTLVAWVASAQEPVASAAPGASAVPPAVESVPAASAASAQPAPEPVQPPANPEPIPDAGVVVVDAAGDVQVPSIAADGGPVDGAPDGPVDDGVDAAPDVAASAPPASAPPPPPTAPAPAPPPPPAPPKADEPPLWNILPILSEPEDHEGGDLAQQILPSLGFGERGNLLAYFVLLLLSALGANLAGRGRRKLPVRGVLPRLVAGLHVGLRALVVLFALALLAKWIPASYAPVFLWVALAAAAAAGWSARDFLPDLFAGIVLMVERRVRPGTWVAGTTFAGEIETLGPRAARLRDAEGRILSVPNRKLLGGPVAIDASRRPRTDVVIRLAAGVPADQARQAIEDAALLSPWRVLRYRPEVRREADDPRAWRVRVRLLEPRFHRPFESALVDHVEENLRQLASQPVAVELASDAQDDPST